MRTNGIAGLLAGVLLAMPCMALAQKPKVVGVLTLAGKPSLREEVFEKRLRELGWIEGKNIRIAYKRAANRVERIPALAEELVKMNVDVVVAFATPVVEVTKKIVLMIPVVQLSADPVGNRFVESLARPGGNMTGISMMMPALTGKQLEILREVSPKLSRVAYLAHGNDRSHKLFLKETEDAARALGIRVQPVIVYKADEIEGAFLAMVKERAEAVVVQPLFTNVMGLGRDIADLAARSRIASISQGDVYADNGGLVSFGPDPLATYVLIAEYVDRVLKGAKPANLPIQQPQKFELKINLRTARDLGITMPQSLLVRADKVIE